MNMNQTILEVIDTLEPIERRVVALCFGIDNERPRTSEEIGEELGITTEQVEGIKINALRKLRHPSFADGLSEQEEAVSINLYPEMNAMIKDLLRRSDEPMNQYILARIEQLETENAKLRGECHADENN